VALMSQCGTYKIVKARFWLWLSGNSSSNLLRCCLFARKRSANLFSDLGSRRVARRRGQEMPCQLPGVGSRAPRQEPVPRNKINKLFLFRFYKINTPQNSRGARPRKTSGEEPALRNTPRIRCSPNHARVRDPVRNMGVECVWRSEFRGSRNTMHTTQISLLLLLYYSQAVCVWAELRYTNLRPETHPRSAVAPPPATHAWGRGKTPIIGHRTCSQRHAPDQAWPQRSTGS